MIEEKALNDAPTMNRYEFSLNPIKFSGLASVRETIFNYHCSLICFLFSLLQVSQTQSEILTQNADLTQLADFDDDETGDDNALSPLPPYSPSAQRKIPWGRLVSRSLHDGKGIDLLPRPSADEELQPQQFTSVHGMDDLSRMFGLSNLRPGDIFNEHVLGRSHKCDVVAKKPATDSDSVDEQENTAKNAGTSSVSVKEMKLHDWALGMISNKHCRIYCMVESGKTRTGTSDSFKVFVEDTSGNGTLINKTTLLRRGEKRLLHSGDEICLLNPQNLSKKIRSNTILQQLMQQHSFIFVNLHHQEAAFSSLHATSSFRTSSTGRPNRTRLSTSSVPSSSKRKPAVDPRSMKERTSPWQMPAPRAMAPTAGAGSSSAAVSLFSRVAAGPAVRRLSSGSRRISPRRRQQRRIEEDYDIRDLLGTGTVGEVRRAIDRRTGQARAVKVIAGRSMMNKAFSEADVTFEAEVSILRELEHPYVVKLVDFYVGPTAVYLVMDLLEGGDLFDRIIRKGRYSETESRRVMRRLLSAIYYLHEDRQVVHRDLKPENILLEAVDNDVDIQLTDFGLAKAVNGEGLKTFCGTPLYFAPEILQRRHTVQGRGRYGKQADMWSLGVILYVLLSGTPPFDLGNGIEAVGGAYRIQFPMDTWAFVSDGAKDLVRKLLVTDPRKRMSVRDACVHPWILQEDGDTHCHPLDDPKLGACQKELFPTDSVGEDEKDPARNEKIAKVVGGAQDVEECKKLAAATAPKGNNDEQAKGCEGGDVRESSPAALTTNKEVGRSENPRDSADDISKEVVEKTPETGSNGANERKCASSGSGKSEREPLSPVPSNNLRGILQLHFESTVRKKNSKEVAANQKEKDYSVSTELSAKKGRGGIETPGASGGVISRDQVTVELSEDEISEFSEKTESISSFGTGVDGSLPANIVLDQVAEAERKNELSVREIDVECMEAIDTQSASDQPKPKRRRVTESAGKKNAPLLKASRARSKPKPRKKTATPKKSNNSRGRRSTGDGQTTISRFLRKK